MGEGEVQMCLICVDCEGVIFLTLTLTVGQGKGPRSDRDANIYLQWGLLGREWEGRVNGLTDQSSTGNSQEPRMRGNLASVEATRRKWDLLVG